MDINTLLDQKEYDFIRTMPRLGRHVILLGLAGSYSYGTNNENSDIDIRGVTLNTKEDILGLEDYEQYVDDNTDTVIYTFNKLVRLLTEGNPNVIELLGLNPEHYLYLNALGQDMIDHTDLFLSKRMIHTFGGYADAQLRRLQNALARDSMPQSEKETHMLNSVRNAMYAFNERYVAFENGSLRVYTDQAENPELETEIYIDTDLKHYPLRDYKNIWSDMHGIIKDYDRIGKRNHKKDDNHLNKHAMHLIRLLSMGIEILEKGEVHTYRKEEHELLLAIRRGDYQQADGAFRSEFYEMVADYEARLHKAASETSLPDEPDREAIREYVMSVNERVVRDEI